MIGAFFLSSLAAILGVYVPGLNNWLDLKDLGLGWVVVVICICIQILLVELLKLIVRTYRKKIKL